MKLKNKGNKIKNINIFIKRTKKKSFKFMIICYIFIKPAKKQISYFFLLIILKIYFDSKNLYYKI